MSKLNAIETVMSNNIDSRKRSEKNYLVSIFNQNNICWGVKFITLKESHIRIIFLFYIANALKSCISF